MPAQDNIVNLELFALMGDRKLVSRDGSSTTLAPVTEADTLLCTVRQLVKLADLADLREIELPVRTLNASLGDTTKPPTSGTFSLRGQALTGARAVGGSAFLLRLYRIQIFDDPENPFLATFDLFKPEAFATLADSVAAFNAEPGREAWFSVELTEGEVIVTTPRNPSGYRRLAVEFIDLDTASMSFYGEQDDTTRAPADSAPINWNADADTFVAALAPVSFPITEASNPAPGCWVFRVSEQFTLTPGAHNRLEPEALPRVRFYQRFGGEWWCEVRLLQLPLAFNEDGHTSELPPPPSVERIREGNPGSEIQPPANEIQALYLPPDFRGTYTLQWNGRETRVLGRDDDTDAIAEALDGMFETAAGRFDVTNPVEDKAYIEFIGGGLEGEAQPLIVAVVNSFPPGVLTFTMSLDRPEMHAALRTAEFLDLPFEVQVELGDPETPEEAGRVVTLFQTTLRVNREKIWKELATVPKINWQRPPAARDYVPFSPDQILFGSQHYAGAFGNGALRSFSFPHNLGTSAFHVMVRENKANGAALVLGRDYDLHFPSEDLLALDLAEPVATPAANALAIVISSAGPISAFVNHHHEIEQINGLVAALAAMAVRLDTLEDLVPQATLSRREERTEPATFEFPPRSELLTKVPEGFDVSKLKTDPLALAKMRAPAMLAAIHDAAVTPSATLPDVVANAGQIISNSLTGGTIFVPGGGGRKGYDLPPGEYAGSDGAQWYGVTRYGTTNTFHPRDYERELFLLHVNPQMWQPGERLQVSFELELAMFNANAQAQWIVAIEAGSDAAATTPAPVGPNLSAITWAAKPLLAQRVIVTEAKQKHKFGALLKRDTAGNVSAGEQLIYNAWLTVPADSLPATAGVVLRARLLGFDTLDNVKNARGFVWYSMTEAKAEIA